MNRKIGVILSFVYTGLEVIVTFIITPYIIRMLGNAEYGVFKLCESITAYLLLLDFGVGQAVIRYISKCRIYNDKDCIAKMSGLFTLIYCGIGVVTIIIGFCLVFFVPDIFGNGMTSSELSTMRILLTLTTITAAVSLGTTGFSNIIIAYEKFKYQKLLIIMQLLARGVLIYFSLEAGMGSVGIVAVQLFLTVVIRMMMIFYVLFVLHIKPVYRYIDKKMIREVVGFSGWIFLMMISTHINRYLDQILLGSLVYASAALIAIYSLGLQIEFYFEHIGYAMNNILMPGVIKFMEKKPTSENICDEMVRIGRYVFALLAFVWLSYYICGQKFIDLWVGSDYYEAYYVSLLLMTVSTFTMTQAIGDNMLTALNELKEWSLYNVAVIVLNVVISVALIGWNPILGVLIGTVFSMFFSGIVIKNYLYIKKMNINIIEYYKRLLNNIWICIALTVIVGIAIDEFIGGDGWMKLIIEVLIISIVYGISMWNYGLNDSEKSYIRHIVSVKKCNDY